MSELQPRPYYLVIVAEGEPAFLTEYATKEDLVVFLRDHFHPETGARVQVFIFQGDRLHITRGGSKYLVQGSEPPIPLFHPPQPSGNVVESGDWFDDDAVETVGPYGYTPFPAGELEEDAPLGDDPEG